MVVVFVLGLIVSSLLERRAEVVSIYNNRKHIFKDAIVAQNELFAEDFPREYQTWLKTADTTYQGEFNSSQRVDVLAARPEMVVLWAGYSLYGVQHASWTQARYRRHGRDPSYRLPWRERQQGYPAWYLLDV